MSISFCTIVFGRRNSGMPYMEYAATGGVQRLENGNFVTHTRPRSPAQVRPAGPAPTMATL